MHRRRTVLTAMLAFSASTLMPAAHSTASKTKAKAEVRPKAEPLRPIAVTVLTEVFGDGQKVTAVVLEYSETIETAKLDPNSFSVRTRRIKRIYANATGLPSETAANGRFVIIELSLKDATAATVTASKGQIIRVKPQASVVQKGPIFSVDGKARPADPRVMEAAVVRNLVVDDFKVLTFQDGATGTTLAYDLFVPRNLDPAKTYPLVLFLHDEGSSGTVPDTTLVQGLGATVWAQAGEQAKRPCFVLAPQYAGPLFTDASEPTAALKTTVDLLSDLASRYPIDPKRLYATGQSDGGK